jgi:Cu+-exporting ATPase
MPTLHAPHPCRRWTALSLAALALGACLFLTDLGAAAAAGVELEGGPTVSTVTLKVEGLHCASCSTRVRKALSSLDGVEGLEEGRDKHHLVVTYHASRVSPDEMVKKVKRTGYRATIVE